MKLKPGVSITWKAKRYTEKTGIPDDLFNEIYGKDAEAKKAKFQFVESKKKPVKDEPQKSSG